MSRPKTPPKPSPAAEMAELLAATDPESAAKLAEHARRHAERARRARARAPVKLGATLAGPPRGPEATGEERGYEHEGPTRSLVLNAFVHGFGGTGLVSVDVTVLYEETLAPKLVEIARRYMVHLLMIMGRMDTAMALAAKLPPVTNDAAARVHMRQAAQIEGAIGAIARDYLAYHEQRGKPERDDRYAHCVMATFAGKLLAYAEGQLGEHVRQEVRAALDGLLQGEAPPRQRRAGPRASPDKPAAAGETPTRGQAGKRRGPS